MARHNRRPHPMRQLDLVDATVLDPNGLLTESVAMVGAGIRIKIQDIGGPGYTGPTGGVALVWRAKDEAGRDVSVPAISSRLQAFLASRPDAASGVIVEAGSCTSLALAEWVGGGLHFHSSGDLYYRQTGAAAAAYQATTGKTKLSRFDHSAQLVPAWTGATKNRWKHTEVHTHVDDGKAYNSFVLATFAADVAGTELYHYLAVYPIGALATVQTIVVQLRAIAQSLGSPSWERTELRGERVWQIGDSITAEVQSDDDRLESSRYLLLEQLAERGPVQPVGHLSDTYSNWRMHSGVGGAKASDVLANIATYLAAISGADVVTIMLGTNDAGAGVLAAAFAVSTQGIVDAIVAAHPAVKIYVAYPTPSLVGADDTLQLTYSAQIDALTDVDGVVDMRTGFVTGTMLDDNVHPNVLGHQHIAGKWAAAIALAGE